MYNRNSLNQDDRDFKCEVEETAKEELKNTNFAKNANDGKLRTFRLALVCSGEYAQFHLTRQNVAGSASELTKIQAVLSAMNTSMTRINGVFEKDLAVRMEIVASNHKVIFLDAATDNITDGNANTMINEVQTICDNEIGAANYDIGHIFSIGGDGLAGVGVVCSNGNKARGVTGIGSPVGDPYDIDYVAHEIGHQFGATHTQNNSCNRTNSTAVEPGSGSTIMGYAGICAPNVLSVGPSTGNSDDHFHAVSIAQMWSTIQSSATCAVQTNTNNAAPVAIAGPDYSIPKSTPFVLRGSATDADGTQSLTYNWEQIDTEIATMPPASTNTGGPTFRSLPSKMSPNRYMPALATVVAGNTASTWEVVPSVAREMNFSFLVRDNHAGGGSTARDDMKILVTNADAFTVTAPSTAVSWDAGSTQTITWNKGTTDTAPINCANVNIKLSTDGGLTFPIILKTNTPNDGTEDITVPDNVTSNGRILVEAADNIFYNVNSTNFTINTTTPTFTMSNTSGNQTGFNTGGESVSYTVAVNFLNGFNETVTLSATGNPSGSQVSFNPATINSNGNVVVTVSNLDGVAANTYTINLLGSSTSVNQNIDLTLEVKEPGYCASTWTQNPKEHIKNVTFNTINNDSGNKIGDGYEDYTSIATNVKRGDTHQVSVTFDTDGYQDNCTVFIDWNKDYVFDSATERYDLGTGLDDVSTRTMDITVPNDAKFGDTTMRVIIEYTSGSSPHGVGACDADHASEWGETEDYKITVDTTASLEDVAFSGFNMYPNPTKGEFTLNLELVNTDKLTVQLFDVRGRMIGEKNYTDMVTNFSEKILFENTVAGLYLVKIINGTKQTTRKLVVK